MAITKSPGCVFLELIRGGGGREFIITCFVSLGHCGCCLVGPLGLRLRWVSGVTDDLVDSGDPFCTKSPLLVSGVAF